MPARTQGPVATLEAAASANAGAVGDPRPPSKGTAASADARAARNQWENQRPAQELQGRNHSTQDQTYATASTCATTRCRFPSSGLPSRLRLGRHLVLARGSRNLTKATSAAASTRTVEPQSRTTARPKAGRQDARATVRSHGQRWSPAETGVPTCRCGAARSRACTAVAAPGQARKRSTAVARRTHRLPTTRKPNRSDRTRPCAGAANSVKNVLSTTLKIK